MAVAASSVVGQVTPLSFFIINMITAMGLALGIDYSLFVLSRYREQRQHGQTRSTRSSPPEGPPARPSCSAAASFVVALFGLLLVPDTILRSLSLGAIIVGSDHHVAALRCFLPCCRC